MTRLEEVVLDLERHAAAAGWDSPPRLYALVDTAELYRQDPDLAKQLGIPEADDSITALEQEPLPGEAELEQVLAAIAWPDTVNGCAIVVERVVLPSEAEAALPTGGDVGSWAAEHPDRQDVRVVVGVLRDGSRHAALRLRAHDSDDKVMTGTDLVPGLTEALTTTLV